MEERQPAAWEQGRAGGGAEAAAAAAAPRPPRAPLPPGSSAEQAAATAAAQPQTDAATLPLPASLPAAALRPELRRHMEHLAAQQALMRAGELAMQRRQAQAPQAQAPPQPSPRRRQVRGQPGAAAQPGVTGTGSPSLSTGFLGSLLPPPASCAAAAPSEVVTLLTPSAVVGAEGQRRLQHLTLALGRAQRGGQRGSPAGLGAPAEEHQPGTASSVSPMGGLLAGRLAAPLATPRAQQLLSGLPSGTPLARGPGSELDQLYGRLQSQDMLPYHDAELEAGLQRSPTAAAAGAQAAGLLGEAAPPSPPALLLVPTLQGVVLMPYTPQASAQLLPAEAAQQQQQQQLQQQLQQQQGERTPSVERAPRSGSQASSNGGGREGAARKRPRKPAKAPASPAAAARKPGKAVHRDTRAQWPAKGPRHEAAARARGAEPAPPAESAPTPAASGVVAAGEGPLSALRLAVRGTAAEAEAPAYVTFHLPAAGAGGEQGGQVLPVRCRFLFQKQLSASDAGGMPRVVLPRLAGKYVRCGSAEGEEVQLLDSRGRVWTWLLKFWEERPSASPSPSGGFAGGRLPEGPPAGGAPAAATAAVAPGRARRATLPPPQPPTAALQRTYIFEGVRPFQQAWRLAPKRVLAFYQMPGGGLLVDPHGLEQHFAELA